MVTQLPSKGKYFRSPAKGSLAAVNGGTAVAQAMRQVNPDVVAAYPITPSTGIVETFSQMVADGLVDTEFVAVESEHSAMSACVGAAAAGVRAHTVTTSQGLALMWEVLYIASGMRLPIVLHCANRSLSAPLCIHCDHSDTMGARDSGWVQLFGENPQEAYDNAIIAVRIAEHSQVLLPALHTQDGYTVTHCMEPVSLLPDEAVREFVGEYQPRSPLLNTKQPVTLGAHASPEYMFEIRRMQMAGMEHAREVVKEVSEEFGYLSGRFHGPVECYRMDDADLALVALGSTAGTAQAVVDEVRARGLKAGVVKVRCYRPFPEEEIAAALQARKAVAVLDRAAAPGGAGHPLFADVCTSLFTHRTLVPVVNYVFGLGGRDALPHELAQVFRDLERVAATGEMEPRTRYLGLRE